MKKMLAICMSLFLFTHFVGSVHAANISASGVGKSILVEDKNVKNGSIISFTNGKYRLSTIPYDATIFGVVSDTPAMDFTDKTLEKSRLVVSSGTAEVLVSARNGAIKVGDLVTTSSTPGIGQKAVDPGYILGSAEEELSSGTGLILVDLHPEFGKHIVDIKQNLFTTIRLGISAPSLTPENALRYILAFLIVILSFVIGFIFFGRASARGIEAVGRNPLAKRIITLTVVLNVGLTLVVIGAGVAIAYLILVL
jgi:hypothetical protein